MSALEEVNALVADAWYDQPHPWYGLASGPSGPLGGPMPSRIIIEYDNKQDAEIPADGYPAFDREVSYQVKFLSTHGYWPFGQQSGLPAFSTSEMEIIRAVSTMIVTQPQAPVSIATRDRLEEKGLLY